MRIELEVNAVGEFTDKELRDFIEFELGGGSIDSDNPFVDDESRAEITRVDIY